MKKILTFGLITIVFLLFFTLIYNFIPEDKLPDGVIIDKIQVMKSERKMEVYSKGKMLKSYTISLGKSPMGNKDFEGDNKTPEGIYYINDKNPNSSYHKNLGISYPDSSDIIEANKLGKSAGGDIKIHGTRNYIGVFIGKFHRLTDWTKGCIAITDSEIDELYSAVPIGTPIDIKP